MKYKYITENNLEKIQNYQFAEYSGKEFLLSYLQSRVPYTDADQKRELILPEVFLLWNEWPALCTMVNLYERLYDPSPLECMEAKWQVDRLVQSFEVKKKLYGDCSYKEGVKVVGVFYKDVRLYLIFSLICSRSYELYYNLKYLNCLLKVNDTLLSLYLPDEFRSLMQYLIGREVQYVHAVAEQQGVIL